MEPPPKEYYQDYGGSPGDLGEFGADSKKEKTATNGRSTLGGIASGISNVTSGGTAAGRDFLDSLFSNVNYDLLVSKTFYFFFFAAFGSLFPLIAVYFKQLGLNPAQTGLLIGFRPFVEFVSGPFWSNIADRWNKWKHILLFSLFCWVAFTMALAFVTPTADSCLVHNGSAILVVPPWQANDRYKRDLENVDGYSFKSPRIPLELLGTVDNYNHLPAEGSQSFDLESENSGGDKRNAKAKDKSSKSKDITTNEPPGTAKPTQSVFAEGKYRLLPHPSIDDYGKSPLPLDHKDIANLDAIDATGLVSPPLSAVVYHSREIQKIFLVLLLLMIIGEFLSAPAIELADAATLGYLGDDMENYGRQRLFGSLGWGISMFFVGIALDHSNIFPNHPCGNEQLVDRNYTVCFAVFSVLMCCAFIAATQFRFKENPNGDTGIQLNDLKDKVIDKVQAKIIKIRKSDRHSLISSDDETPDYGYDQYKTGSGLPSSRDTTPAASDPEGKLHISLQDKDGTGKDAQGNMLTDVGSAEPDVNTSKPSPYVPRGRPGQSGRLPQWVPVLKMFGTVKHGAVLFVLWFMGFGVGLVFAFLFWHLQDMHGTPTLFGIASVINHISEVFAYFFAKRLISRFGHVKVLYAGMFGNVCRYLYISWLNSPWWVLPFEFLQGLTHAAVWAAGCSYLTQHVSVPLKPTAQGILMAIHHGLGRAMGTIIGGAFVHSYGTEYTFRGYGIATIIILVGYVCLNYFYIDKYTPDEGPTDITAIEETHLAPYGVPISMSHSRSKNDMDDTAGGQQQYGAAGPGSTAGNFLRPSDVGGYQSSASTGPDKNPYHAGYDHDSDDLAKIDMSHLGKFRSTDEQKYSQQPQQRHQQPPQQYQRPPQQQYNQQPSQQYNQPPPQQYQQQPQQPQQPQYQQYGQRGSRDAVLMGNAPRPTTETHRQQPRNTDEADWY